MISREVISQGRYLENRKGDKVQESSKESRAGERPVRAERRSNAIVHCIVLRDRETETSEHLENCTGKDELKAKFASIQSERRERVLQTFPDGGRSDKATSQTEKDQARKSTGRMPWHRLPKKDAANCEKPWGAVSRHRSRDLRMGKPGRWKERSLSDESIV